MQISRRLAIFFAPLISAAAASAQPADLVVQNGSVWTGESAQAQAQAFAVRDGKFVRVGSDEDMQDLIGPETVVEDAQGRRVLPGIIDTHVHLLNGSMSFGWLDLRPAVSREDFLRLVREYALTLPEDDWVIGRSWSAESWPDPRPPTPDEIDEAAGGRPAFFIRMDGHSLIAGAEAIRLANVTRDSPADPPGGKIGRSPDGALTGAFYEQAMGIIRSQAPRMSQARVRELFLQTIHHLNKNGVTQVGAIDTKRFVESHIKPVDDAGDLTIRVGVSLTGGDDDLDSWIPILEWADQTRTISDRLTILGFKGYMDGALGSRTAWMNEPFLDDPHDPDNVGFPLAAAENGTLPELIKLAGKMNLQPAVHAIGDRANNTLLNWYQFMGPNRWMIRPRIEHAQHLSPADIPRFVRMSVIPSMQPYHKADDGRYAEERLGPDRIQSSYAFRSLYDSGAYLSFGSDWPVVSCNPFLGMHAAVTAQTLGDASFVPEQSLTIEESLRCYTFNASWALHTPGQTGMIQPDHFADFIVIDRDVLNIDADDIENVVVLQTWLGGRLVYDAAAEENE